MIRDAETRHAYEIVKADKKRQRTERKEAARQHIRAIVASTAPGKRQPRERDNGFLAFVRRHPCCVCGRSPVEAAHTRFTNRDVGRMNPGMGCKPSDRFCTPLCPDHHRAQHARGNEAAWWAEQGVDPDAISAQLYAAFLAGGEPIPMVVRPSRPFGTSKRTQTPCANHSGDEI
jgi:hypothetical protein